MNKASVFLFLVAVYSSGCNPTCEELSRSTHCSESEEAFCTNPQSVLSEPVCQCAFSATLRNGHCVDDSTHDRNSTCCDCLTRFAVEPGSFSRPAPGCYRTQQNDGEECVDLLDAGEGITINFRSDGVDSCLQILCDDECPFLSR